MTSFSLRISRIREGLISEEISLPNLFWHEMELKEAEEKFLAGDVEVLDWQLSRTGYVSRPKRYPNLEAE